MQVYHGTIISLDQNNHIYTYLVEDKGRIAYLGNELPDAYAQGSVLELKERALLPAFGDGHMHFSNWALIAGSYFDVRQARDIPQIQAMIKEQTALQKGMKAVVAFGASKHSIREKRLITRTELDAACPDIPLFIFCYDGHSAVINTKMAGKFPERIQKLRGFKMEEGHLFNEAYLAGTDYATKLVSPIDMVKSISKSYDLLAQKGIGLIHATEGIGFPKDLDVSLVSLLAKGRTKKSHFQTRLFFQTMNVQKVLKRNFPRIGGCFETALDGCFGACDAALHQPYHNDPANTGILFHTRDEVIDFAKKSNRAGLQIEMHAIGDAAVSQAVTAIEAALQDCPRKDHRHTIIHACLIQPEDLKKIAELQIGITLQPGFLISPLEPVSYLTEILGPQRVRHSSPLRSILDAGIHLSGGSDAPVTHPDPIEGIYGACNHPYDPEQSVSVLEALKMFTWEVARTGFDEKDRGSLETGKIADMVILNKDPLKLDPKDLRSLKTEQLILNGKPYESGSGVSGMIWNGLIGRKEKI